MITPRRHLPIVETHGNVQQISITNICLSTQQVQAAWLMGFFFLMCFLIDWRTNVFDIPGRRFVAPISTIFFLILVIRGFPGHGQIRFVYERTIIAKFGLYVYGFLLTILLGQLWSGPYTIPMEDQYGAYWSFAQSIILALLGYRFTKRREDAAWLLHRFAVGTACVCALSYILIAMGRSETGVYLTTGSMPLGEGDVFSNMIAAPNWGIHGFLTFGYCWFLTRTLIDRRLFRWSTVGLLACCELWVQMTKSTIFGIIPGTLVIVWLLLAETRRRVKVLVSMAAILGIGTAGFMNINTVSNGEFEARITEYIAGRYFRVEHLNRVGQSLSEIATVGSSGRIQWIWPQAIQRFEASPVFGSGFNQYFSSPVGPVPIHNAYLDVLIGVGLVGTLPVLLGFLWWFRTIWRAVRLPENSMLLVPCLGYVFFFFAVNAGDLLRYFYTPMMFFGLMAGIAMKVALLPPEHGSSSRSLQGVNVAHRFG